jgi:hypothetical protein
MGQLRRSKLRKWAGATSFTANHEWDFLEWIEDCKGGGGGGRGSNP